MPKHTKRFTVTFDADFGVPAGKHSNAYQASSVHANILEALAAGSIDPAAKVTVYVELGTGDVVEGRLVHIAAADVCQIVPEVQP